MHIRRAMQYHPLTSVHAAPRSTGSRATAVPAASGPWGCRLGHQRAGLTTNRRQRIRKWLGVAAFATAPSTRRSHPPPNRGAVGGGERVFGGGAGRTSAAADEGDGTDRQRWRRQSVDAACGGGDGREIIGSSWWVAGTGVGTGGCGAAPVALAAALPVRRRLGGVGVGGGDWSPPTPGARAGWTGKRNPKVADAT